MDSSTVITVVLAGLVGVGSGVLAALLGVGGAVITTPAVRVLGATPIQAVGSTVPAIFPGAIAGTLRYAREGLVDWSAALGLGISGSIIAVGGALVSDRVPGGVLMVFTAVLMLWSGISVARGGRRSGGTSSPTPSAALVVPDGEGGLIGEAFEGTEAFETETALDYGTDDVPDIGGAGGPGGDAAGGGAAGGGATGGDAVVPRHPLPLLVLLGAAAGFVAGLLGVGGGIVIMPVLTGPLKVPMKAAVASSLVAVAIFSVPTLITHAVLGHIDWTYALPLMIGVVPGARIGSRLTIGADERTIRRLFGIVIVVFAVIYGASEIAAM